MFLGEIMNKWEEKFEKKYNIAKAFYEDNGHLLIPKGYIVDGIDMYRWIVTLRAKYNNLILDSEIIKKMDLIGMCWDSLEYMWQLKFELLIEYCILNNDFSYPINLEYKGVNLGDFISAQRCDYNNGNILEYRKRLLDSINFVWDRSDNWYVFYNRLVMFYKENGHCKLGEDIICNGKSLKNWYYRQKKLYIHGKLDADKIKLLESVDFNFDLSYAEARKLDWNYMYGLALEFYNENKHLDIMQKEGMLGRWISKMRVLYHQGLLEREKIIKLNEIGMIWFSKNTKNNYNLSRKLLIDTLKVVKEEVANNKERVKRREILYK